MTTAASRTAALRPPATAAVTRASSVRVPGATPGAAGVPGTSVTCQCVVRNYTRRGVVEYISRFKIIIVCKV